MSNLNCRFFLHIICVVVDKAKFTARAANVPTADTAQTEETEVLQATTAGEEAAAAGDSQTQLRLC